MEDFNLTPIGGRNDKNCQGPLGKPPKLGKSDMTPKWAGPYGPSPGHLKFLVNIVATCTKPLGRGQGPEHSWPEYVGVG